MSRRPNPFITDEEKMAYLFPRILVSEELFYEGTPCWIWQKCLAGGGYGQFSALNKRMFAHREFYKLLVGEVPRGMQLDHLCRNRACCSPWHLEAVTQQENMLRGRAGCNNYEKTQCVRGHEFDEGNTMRVKRKTPSGGFVFNRQCKTCYSLRCKGKL